MLEIDVTGSGTTAGTHYDKFVVGGASTYSLNGVNNTNVLGGVDLVVDLVSANANTLTILTAEAPTTASRFHNYPLGNGNYAFIGGTADLTYNAGYVTLSNIVVPEPASAGLLGLAAIGMLGRRRCD